MAGTLGLMDLAHRCMDLEAACKGDGSGVPDAREAVTQSTQRILQRMVAISTSLQSNDVSMQGDHNYG
jgi:HPt (histidine-containing phosphotransfer) domain-containing protein